MRDLILVLSQVQMYDVPFVCLTLWISAYATMTGLVKAPLTRHKPYEKALLLPRNRKSNRSCPQMGTDRWTYGRPQTFTARFHRALQISENILRLALR